MARDQTALQVGANATQLFDKHLVRVELAIANTGAAAQMGPASQLQRLAVQPGPTGHRLGGLAQEVCDREGRLAREAVLAGGLPKFSTKIENREKNIIEPLPPAPLSLTQRGNTFAGMPWGAEEAP
jgi:hypothetical protein